MAICREWPRCAGRRALYRRRRALYDRCRIEESGL